MEDDLIRRAAAGDQQAFCALVESYTRLVQRTALALLGDVGLAEDATQEAWLDVWRALPRFELDKSFRPWLLVIVANRARKQTRRRFNWLPLPLLGLIDRQALEAPAPLRWPSPDSALGAALARLNLDQQQVLNLRYYADLELEEIARITGVPLGTVKSRLHRALQNLRRAMQPEVIPIRVEE